MHSSKTLSMALVAAGLLVVGACTVQTTGKDSASGGDHKRDLAKLVPLNRSVTDSVSAPKGDHTDWKFIKVKDKGELYITVSVDNPDVVGSIIVYNELGEPLQRKTINGKGNTYEFDIPADPGKYYVRMQVAKYETVYSVANRFEKEEPKAVVVVSTPATPKKHRRKHTHRPKKATPKPPEPEDDPTKIVVTTTILNVVPWKEGKASRITFRQGAAQGIKRGATVAISSGGSCVVKEVYESASVCFVNKPPTEFKAGTKVVITSTR